MFFVCVQNMHLENQRKTQHYSQLNCCLCCEWEMCYETKVYVDVLYITLICLPQRIQIQTLVLLVEQSKMLKHT